MGKVLNDAIISEYQSKGSYSPFTIFDPDEARSLRAALEAVEGERGPVFTENRAKSGDPIKGSYRFKSHLLFKWLSDVVRNPNILNIVEDLIGPDRESNISCDLYQAHTTKILSIRKACMSHRNTLRIAFSSPITI